jgi:hypothetical protein
MKNNLIITFLICTIVFLTNVVLAHSYVVSNSKDSGDGSIRAAIENANKSAGANVIYIKSGNNIKILSSLSYTSTAPLFIYGQGQTIHAMDDFTILESTNGGDMSIHSINFRGPGGFNIENRADLDGVGGKGILLNVRDNQYGMVKLVLNDVKVSDVANHGIHVSDCDVGATCGAGGGGAGGGSPASISVSLNNVVVDNVGQGMFDADGLRVDERDNGDLIASILNSSFTRVGADGVELDEGQAGSVIAQIENTSFNNNGYYCHPDILEAYLPEEDEGEFEDGQMTESAVPPAITGSPDDGCFEREVSLYDSGFVEEYEFGIDVDDGFDVDEAGPGDIYAEVTRSTIIGNWDEGLDFDEEQEGSINMTIIDTIALSNTDDGYKHSEEGPGNVSAFVINSSSEDNGGKGFVFEEEEAGNVMIMAQDVTTSNNDDSDGTGMELVQEDSGYGIVRSISSSIADGFDIEGVESIN